MARNLAFATAILLAAAVGSALRGVRLDHRPMHQDEAIHAFRFDHLLRTGQFDYNPHDYHGPTLYYATLPQAAFDPAGGGWVSESPYRTAPVAAGVLLVLLGLAMSRGLGRPEMAAGALLIAVSPAFVFYSRYYVQEMLLVLLTGATIVFAWRFLRSRRVVWAMSAGLAAGLSHATKETCIIAWASMIVAGMAAWGVGRLIRRRGRTARRPSGPVGMGITLALATAVVGSIACFSAGFLDWSNVVESIRTWQFYAADRAGGAGLHAKPWHYYLSLLAWHRTGGGWPWTEAAVLGLFLAGAAETVRMQFRRDPRAPLYLFLLLYAAAMTAAYSAIPYKTPWNLLSFYHAMLLVAGLGAIALIRWARWWPARGAVVLILLIAAGHLGWQAWSASVWHATDPGNPYTYAQSLEDVRTLGRQVSRYAAAGDAPADVRVYAPDHDYWPVPFYIHGAGEVHYGQAVPEQVSAPIVVAPSDWADRLRPALGRDALYVAVGTYQIRPARWLTLWVRADLWQQAERMQVAKGDAPEHRTRTATADCELQIGNFKFQIERPKEAFAKVAKTPRSPGLISPQRHRDIEEKRASHG